MNRGDVKANSSPGELRDRSPALKPKPGKSLRGLWADLKVDDLSEEDFRQLRREMWAKFPRENI